MADLTTIRTNSGVPFTVSRPHGAGFLGLLNDLEASGHKIAGNQSGGLHPRNIAGTNTPAPQSFGRATDINWDQNARGTSGNLDPETARGLASKYGLKWGGDWKNPDPMHFEIAAAARGNPPAAGPAGPAAAYPQAQQREAMPSPQDQTPPMGILDTLAGRMQSPLVQGGLGLLLAASQGGNMAAALQGGLQTGGAMARNDLDVMKARREMQRQQIMDEFWKGIGSNKALSSLPPELLEVAKGLPPDQGGPLIGNYVSRRKDVEQMGEIDRQRAQIELEKSGQAAQMQQERMFKTLENIRNMGKPQAAKAPAVGAVEDGYRFKGGNPADPNAWEKQ